MNAGGERCLMQLFPAAYSFSEGRDLQFDWLNVGRRGVSSGLKFPAETENATDRWNCLGAFHVC